MHTRSKELAAVNNTTTAMSSATTDRGLGPRVLVSAGATYIASNVDNRVTVNVRIPHIDLTTGWRDL